MKEWPKIFENAQVGDEVYDEAYGDGEIVGLESTIYPIKVKFRYCYESFTYNGFINSTAINPTLSYRKGIVKCPIERPKPEKEIDWKEWEGKEIEVKETEDSSWRKAKLYRYQPEFYLKFACYEENNTRYPLHYPYARIIEEQREPEIDWSRVPEGTKVRVSNNIDKVDFNGVSLFMGYFPRLPYTFWVFDNGTKDSAHGFIFCKLAEPCKPEWGI